MKHEVDWDNVQCSYPQWFHHFSCWKEERNRSGSETIFAFQNTNHVLHSKLPRCSAVMLAIQMQTVFVFPCLRIIPYSLSREKKRDNVSLPSCLFTQYYWPQGTPLNTCGVWLAKHGWSLVFRSCLFTQYYWPHTLSFWWWKYNTVCVWKANIVCV